MPWPWALTSEPWMRPRYWPRGATCLPRRSRRRPGGPECRSSRIRRWPARSTVRLRLASLFPLICTLQWLPFWPISTDSAWKRRCATAGHAKLRSAPESRPRLPAPRLRPLEETPYEHRRLGHRITSGPIDPPPAARVRAPPGRHQCDLRHAGSAARRGARLAAGALDGRLDHRLPFGSADSPGCRVERISHAPVVADALPAGPEHRLQPADSS